MSPATNQTLTSHVEASEPADTSPRLKYVRSQGIWEGRMKTRLHVRDFDPFYTGRVSLPPSTGEGGTR